MSASRLQVVIGSTRPGRVGEPVARWFEQFATEHGGFEVELVDLAEVDLPIFDEPNHPRLREYEHEHTKRWSAIVERADAYVFVVPEYNYGVNAATKNAIDYLNQEWARKPVGFVSYGGVAAGTRSVQMLRQIVGALRMLDLTEAVNIPFVTQFLEDGRFVPNDELTTGATTMLDELAQLASSLARLRQPSRTEVLKRFFDAERAYMSAGGTESGDEFDAFLPTLAEDAVMHQAANLPYGGDWVGHDGFRNFFVAMSRTWSSLELSELEFFEPQGGGDRVVVLMRMVATSRSTGAVMDEPMVQIVEVRDGLIRGFWPFYWDVSEAARLTTPQESHHAENAG